MTHTEFIEAEEIITDVVQELDDSEYRKRSFPYYMGLVQRAVTELAYDTAFDDRVFEAVIPDNLRIDLPGGLANIEKVLLFNGEACDASSAVNCYWHRHFQNKPEGGYLASNQWHNDNDVMQPSMGGSSNPPSNLYFWNTVRGKLMLSSNCSAFDRVHVRYAGLGYLKFGDKPMVPAFAREAISAWVLCKAARGLTINDPQHYSNIANHYHRELHMPGGPWSDAKKRIAVLDRAQREDMERYGNKFGETA